MFGSRSLPIEPGPRVSEDALATLGEKFPVWRYEPALWNAVPAVYLTFEAIGRGAADSNGELRIYRQTDDLLVGTVTIAATLGAYTQHSKRIDTIPLMSSGGDFYTRVFGGDATTYPEIRNLRVLYVVGGVGGVRLSVPSLDQVVGESRTLSILARFPFVADDETDPSVPLLDVLPTRDAFAVLLNTDPIVATGTAAYQTVNGGNHYRYLPERGDDVSFYLEVGGGTRKLSAASHVPGEWAVALQYTDDGEIINASEVIVDNGVRTELVRSAAFRLEGGREVVPVWRFLTGTNYLPSIQAIRLLGVATGSASAPMLRSGWSEDLALGDWESTGTAWSSIGIVPVLPSGSFAEQRMCEAVHKRKSGTGNAEVRLANSGTATVFATLVESTTDATLDVSADVEAAMVADGIALQDIVEASLWDAEVEQRGDAASVVSRVIGARLAGSALHDPRADYRSLSARWTLGLDARDLDRTAAWIIGSVLVDLDRAAAWNLGATRARDIAATWRLGRTTSLDRIATWAIPATVDFDHGAAWNLGATRARDVASSWRLERARQVDRSTAWAVAAAVSADLAASWVGSGYVAAAALWRVLVAREIDRAAAWAVGVPTSIDRAAAWSVSAGLDTSRTAAWTVVASRSLDRAALWAVGTLTILDRASAWTVAAIRSRDVAAGWEIPLVRSVDVAAAWRAASARSLDRAAAWMLAGVTATDRTAAWRLDRAVDLDRPATWAVEAGSPEVDRTAAWAVYGTRSADRAAAWVVDLVAPQQNLAAAWAVLLATGTTDHDRAARWHVQPAGSATLSSVIAPTLSLVSTVTPTVSLASTITPSASLTSTIDP